MSGFCSAHKHHEPGCRQCESSNEPSVASNDLLAAELALAKVTEQMAEDFQEHGDGWPRDWMQKHSDDRATLIKARNILLDRAEQGS